MTEDEMLDRVTLWQLLAPLPVYDREMLLLIYHVGRPEAYTGTWPPTLTDIGLYIGTRYGPRPLSEAAVRYRRDVLMKRWALGKR